MTREGWKDFHYKKSFFLVPHVHLLALTPLHYSKITTNCIHSHARHLLTSSRKWRENIICRVKILFSREELLSLHNCLLLQCRRVQIRVLRSFPGEKCCGRSSVCCTPYASVATVFTCLASHLIACQKT